MSLKKTTGVILTVVLLVITTIAVGLVINNRRCKEEPICLSDAIAFGMTGDLTLTIYFRDPFMSTWIPISVEMLMDFGYDYRITVNTGILMDHRNLLLQIANADLVPIETESSPEINTRIYYFFEYDGNVIFSFTETYAGMLINGNEYQWDDDKHEIFYDVIMPFLPVDALNLLKEHLGRI